MSEPESPFAPAGAGAPFNSIVQEPAGAKP